MNKKSARKLIILVPTFLFYIFCLFFITENTDVTSISLYLDKRKAEAVIDKVEEYFPRSNAPALERNNSVRCYAGA